jgi:predicted MPP superfamily phosphohydrolase
MNVAGAAALAALATLLYGVLIAPRRLQINRRDVHLPRWPRALDGYQVAHLSDLHFGGLTSARPHLLAIRDLHPDLFVATGDFIERPADIPECVEMLGALSARDGTWCVLGNHDHWARRFDRHATAHLVESLEAAGLTVLTNTARPIERDGARFWIAGVDDPYRYRDDLDAALGPVAPGEPALLLAHSPDIFLRLGRGLVDLAFTGHSHGGQVRTPWGPIFTRTTIRLPDVLGLREVNGVPANMSGGLGATVPLRFLCPPEVTILTLHAGCGG